MHRLASRYLRRPLVGILALTGCATVQSSADHRYESPGQRYLRVRDSVETASRLEADEVASVPRIRLLVPPALYASTRFVDASFRVTEDAYVLVVAVDLDRRVRVLFPESPDESGLASMHEPHHLTRFFAGFGGQSLGYGRFDARYDISQRISPFGGTGVLLAIASDRPLQLERLRGEDGDWDEHELSQLVFEQSLPGAAQAVGRAVVLTGQEFNTDYTTFAGGRTLGAYSTFASSSFGDCGFASDYGFDGYGYGYGNSYGDGSGMYGAATRFVGFYRRGEVTYARYASGGACSRPVYYDVPVPTPVGVPRDTTRRDTTSTGKRPPHVPGAPRFPSVTGDNTTMRRLAPADARGADRERPVVASGLRFRRPEQLPAEPTERMGRFSPRDGEPYARRLPPEAERMQPAAQHPREEPAVARPVERIAPEQRQAPRSEPVRAEPVRVEPVRSEPAPREPSPHESTPREPVRATPAPH
jgi:hypothetical protein